MRRRLLVLLTLAACAPAGPTITDADRAAIMEQRAATVAAWNSGDTEAAYAVYADDAVVMFPNQPAVVGKLAIKQAREAFPPVSDAKLHGEEFLTGGDMAVIRGASAMLLLPGGSAAVADTLKYIEVWRRQTDGGWKLQWDIANTDRPAEAFLPPAPSK